MCCQTKEITNKIKIENEKKKETSKGGNFEAKRKLTRKRKVEKTLENFKKTIKNFYDFKILVKKK